MLRFLELLTRKNLCAILGTLFISYSLTSNTLNRAKIYDHLISFVLNRKYTQDGRHKKYNKRFYTKDLRNYLSYLAFKIFQNKKGYLHRTDLENDNITNDFANKFLKTKRKGEGLKDVLKDLFTLFYFREIRTPAVENNQEEEYAFEFLHKSFYEFLMCEYIWNKIKVFFLEIDAFEGYKERTIKEVESKIYELFFMMSDLSKNWTP